MPSAIGFSAALSSKRVDSAALNRAVPAPTKNGLIQIFYKYISKRDGAAAILELGHYVTKWPQFFLRKFTPFYIKNTSDTLMDGKNVLAGLAIPEAAKSFMGALDTAARTKSINATLDAVESGSNLGNNVCDVASLLESRDIFPLPFRTIEKVGSVFTLAGGTVGTGRALKFLSQFNVLHPNSPADSRAVKLGGLRLFEKASYMALGFLGVSNWALQTAYSSWTMTAAATSGIGFKIMGDFYNKM